MATIIDITGKRFGRWTVLQRTVQDRPGSTQWLCRCDCGRVKDRVRYTALTKGSSSSCGCLRLEMLTKPDDVVHATRNPTYVSWVSMKTRCLNAAHPTYRGYGARGIKVCPQWVNDFDQFLADMGNRPDGMTLDRKDNSGDYTPENCHWASRVAQSGNRRSNVRVLWNGKVSILTEVARAEGVDYHLLRYRMLKGASVGEAITSLRSEGRHYKERAAARL